MCEILRNLYEWREWESIGHGIVLLIVSYVLYLLCYKKNERTITNLLLLSIVFAIGVLIHQNINARNRTRPAYRI